MNRTDAKQTRLAPVLVIVAGLVVLAVMLFRVPLVTVFTIGLLLILPLLMVGMHGGSHGREQATSRDDVRPDSESRTDNRRST